ncbi:FecR domain-containing protein [Lacibacterium aquatile]|uniref:FecR domain-containing protein n=1 Tax=Lacibacterium aquatile TaxID=1168082 RepID=A0ABW5DKB6_9PROT
MSTSLTSGAVSAQQPAEPAGVISASQGATRSLSAPGRAGEKILYLGDQTYRNETLRNETSGPTHIMFLDQSSLTIGPGAELTIDEFVYDPGTRQGKISLNLVKGLVRVVGGDISKTNETTIKTPVGTIGIRGGITVIDSQISTTRAEYLFGQSMRTTDQNGNTQTVTRAGFGVDLNSSGDQSPPRRTTASDLSSLLNRLETQPTQQPNRAQSPAPPGQLISTGNRGVSPNNTIAPDRLKSVTDTNSGVNPQLTLKDILGNGTTPIPAS